MAQKKIHARNLITKKNNFRSKFPHPPPANNLSNGLSLSATNARAEVLIYETGYEISGVFLYFRFEI